MTPDLERYDPPAYIERLERENAKLREVVRDLIGNLDAGYSDTMALARRACAVLDGK